MTQKVDFYILNKKREAAYLYLAALVEKIYNLDKTVLILTKDKTETAYIDELLWSYRDTSFLPHDIYDPGEASPIFISEQSMATQDVLINLSENLPANVSSFPRVIEFILNDEHLLVLGRQKYRQYQNFGCELQTIHIKENS